MHHVGYGKEGATVAGKANTAPRLRRLSIGLPAPQLAWLRAEAERIGRPIGEVIRRIIDEKREEATR
jgi:hypothetical protein